MTPFDRAEYQAYLERRYDGRIPEHLKEAVRYAHLGPYWRDYLHALDMADLHRSYWGYFKTDLDSAVRRGDGDDATLAAQHMYAHKCEFRRYKREARSFARRNRVARPEYDLVTDHARAVGGG